MYKIGITGSIGTGKTTIASMFRLFGIPIFDADKEIKKVLASKKIKKKLIDIWPLIDKNNEIDKHKLKSIIFSNKSEKKKLEKLLHPFLDIEKIKFEKTNHYKKILVYDVPLIYETKSDKKYNLIILANCNAKIQKKRVLERDQISNSLFKKILASQLSFKEKLKFKPEIIDTNKPKLFILLKVIVILVKVIVKSKYKWKKKEN